MTMAITTREISYQAKDGTTLIGYFASPVSDAPVAGVIVAPEWWGRNAYTEQRARELAEYGYAAFAIDMYGDKKTTTNVPQANEWMTQTFQNANTIVDRAQAALATLATQTEVDENRLAAIGFCYGGKVVLDLARTGAPLRAVATFHAANVSPRVENDAENIQAELLILHGEKDSMLSLDAIESFKQEMTAAQIKHEVIVFKDAKHGFSNVLADQRAKEYDVDLGYNPEAEQQSLTAMYALLERQLGH